MASIFITSVNTGLLFRGIRKSEKELKKEMSKSQAYLSYVDSFVCLAKAKMAKKNIFSRFNKKLRKKLFHGFETTKKKTNGNLCYDVVSRESCYCVWRHREREILFHGQSIRARVVLLSVWLFHFCLFMGLFINDAYFIILNLFHFM